MKESLSIAMCGILGIETISMIEIESSVKIVCQIVVTIFTVYYLITKIKKHKQ